VTSTEKSTGLATRLLARPALRFQADGRLVTLVRQGYESAFEEIVRRYGSALRSYAAAIVSSQRADDVTQDAFTKAYLALRDSDKEIKLRPWLYRIVRNTALSDIRDRPPQMAALTEAYAAGDGPEEMTERREEIKGLLAGLQSLPEPQRAAIVMRELEGLSHEQIAASLGLSGGAVRQSIYRARRALREGVGMLLPLPVLRLLLDGGLSSGASATAAGGGAGIAVKTGVAALLAAGTVTTGVALNGGVKPLAKADTPPARESATSGEESAALAESSEREGRGPGDGGEDRRGRSGDGRSGDERSGSGHGGSDSSGPGGGDTEASTSGSSGSGSGSGSGSSGSGSGTSGSGSSSSGPGSDGGTSGSGSGGSGDGGSDGLPD
jgi:RNA polymerase sigma factor (sigma-70 family)